MIQIYASGELVYDNRLPAYSLTALAYTAGVNKAGTATITMPPGHPAYNAYGIYKDIVSIYVDGLRVFRGRPLQPTDDFRRLRTITCEGERCFFRDAVMRPYLYQADPATILTDLVRIYNEQVEEDKRFLVGTITVTDPNDYVRLEATTAEQVSATIDKLVERCGGYIVFTDNEDGARVVNWYDALTYRSSQLIEFGSNLTDLSRVVANTELATRILPFGAKDETTGEYLTIKSVNGGVDYIQDDEAVALRGIITKPVYWNDVTEPLNLLRKAQEYLATAKNLITSLQLTAVDLSVLDKSIDSFREGDIIQVRSKPHELADEFLLTDKTVDLLNPSGSTVTLGKDKSTLTGQTVAGDKAALSELQIVERNIRADYQLNVAAVVEETRQLLTSLIQQTSESIMLEVAETYTTNDQVTSSISTSLTQLSDSFTFAFDQLSATVDENDAEARTQFDEIHKYITFQDGAIHLGASDSGVTLSIENDLILFKKNGAQFGWWDGVDFHTGNIVIEVNERAQFGNFAAIPRKKGNLSWLKVK